MSGAAALVMKTKNVICHEELYCCIQPATNDFDLRWLLLLLLLLIIATTSIFATTTVTVFVFVLIIILII